MVAISFILFSNERRHQTFAGRLSLLQRIRLRKIVRSLTKTFEFSFNVLSFNFLPIKLPIYFNIEIKQDSSPKQACFLCT